MAGSVNIPEEMVVPGDLLAFDYEIVTRSADIEAWAISKIKQEVWAHPKLDYQSSRVMTMGSLEHGREVELLRVWAIVRREEKQTRVPIQEASMGSWVLVGAGIALGVAGAMVLSQVTKNLGVAATAMGEAAEQTFKWATLLVIAIIAYLLLK
jgi:hypothetical protein